MKIFVLCCILMKAHIMVRRIGQRLLKSQRPINFGHFDTSFDHIDF